MGKRKLVLASASPARRKLLQAAGIEPEVLVSGIDESVVTHESAEALCLSLAQLKARAVAERMLVAERGADRTLVLGCDSVLSFDGRILGKPIDAEDAIQRWLLMRGRSGVLHTGHCLIEMGDGGAANGSPGHREAATVASTKVYFAAISEAEIADYVATGEPLHVAGAFTIDGLGGPFIERVEGDPGTVVGLSLPLLRTLLADFEVRISDLWTTPPHPEPLR